MSSIHPVGGVDVRIVTLNTSTPTVLGTIRNQPLVKGMFVRALASNSGTVCYIGNKDVSSSKGAPVYKADTYPVLWPVDNPLNVYGVSDTDNDKVAVWWA